MTQIFTMQNPTVQQLWDSLMAHIEPDLVSGALPYLDAKYALESKQKQAIRMVRYQKAIALCSERFTTLAARWKGELHAVNTKYMQSQSTHAITKEHAQISSLEDAFNQA